jgi:hypothetical protein
VGPARSSLLLMLAGCMAQRQERGVRNPTIAGARVSDSLISPTPRLLIRAQPSTQMRRARTIASQSSWRFPAANRQADWERTLWLGLSAGAAWCGRSHCPATCFRPRRWSTPHRGRHARDSDSLTVVGYTQPGKGTVTYDSGTRGFTHALGEHGEQKSRTGTNGVEAAGADARVAEAHDRWCRGVLVVAGEHQPDSVAFAEATGIGY